MSIKRRAYVIPTGLGQILVNLGFSYGNPREAWTPEYVFPGSLFIHELTHVWQIHSNTLFQYWGESISNQWEDNILGSNVYTPNENAGWAGNNFEQQAKIADQCFTSIYNTPSKRCSWQEEMITQNIRGGQKFPFVATSVRETKVEFTGNKTVYGSIEWSFLNVIYPANTSPENVFEIIIMAPFMKTETVNNCNGAGLGNSVYTSFRKITVPVEIYSAQETPSGDPMVSPKISCSFRITNLPEIVPLYISVSNTAEWQPGTMIRKPERQKTVFSAWIESSGAIEIKPNEPPKFYVKGGYGPVAPDQKINNKIEIERMQTDGPVNKTGIEKKQIINPASSTPVIKKNIIIKN
jgi:hypothetical protein